MDGRLQRLLSPNTALRWLNRLQQEYDRLGVPVTLAAMAGLLVWVWLMA
jgi:hypothetical protein